MVYAATKSYAVCRVIDIITHCRNKAARKLFTFLSSSLPSWLQAGKEVQDPNDSCTTISCSEGADGNVTRREKETTCDDVCDLGYIYKPAGPGRYAFSDQEMYD